MQMLILTRIKIDLIISYMIYDIHAINKRGGVQVEYYYKLSSWTRDRF